MVMNASTLYTCTLVFVVCGEYTVCDGDGASVYRR